MEYLDDIFEGAINHFAEQGQDEAVQALQAVYLQLLAMEKVYG